MHLKCVLKSKWCHKIVYIFTDKNYTLENLLPLHPGTTSELGTTASVRGLTDWRPSSRLEMHPRYP